MSTSDVTQEDTATNAYTDDTIAAIATPPGVGGLGIVRISGPDAFAIGLAHLPPRASAGRGRAATLASTDLRRTS